MLVVIKWFDIIGEDHNPWSTLEEIKTLKPAPITTIGKVVEDNDDFLTVVSSWDESSDTFGNINVIPKGVVREICKISLDSSD